MVIKSLFKTETGAESFLAGYEADTQIVWFWLHERNRLTDGHIALPKDGVPRICVNWSTQGAATSIAERSVFDEAAWRETVGLSEMDDAQLAEIVEKLQITMGDRAPRDAFADAIDQAIGETADDQNWQHIGDLDMFKTQRLAV